MLVKSFVCLGLGWALCLAAAGCTRDPKVARQQFLASGDVYLAAGKPAEAAIEYANAVRLDLTAGDARLKLAEAYLASGNKRAAMPEFVRAADLLPDSDEAQIKAGIFLLQGGMFQDALKRARNVLNRNPKSVEALTLLGNALAGTRNVDDAVSVLERAVEIDPERVGIQTNLAILELAKGDSGQAEAAFKRVVEISKGSPESYLGLGNYYRAVRRFDEAQAALDRAFALNPKSVAISQALASLQIEAGREDGAERYLRAIVELTKDTAPRFALANFLASRGRTAEALTILGELAADPAQFAAATSRRALLLYATGHPAEAHQAIDEVLKRNPRDATAMALKGRLLLSDGEPHEALDTVKAATVIDPSLAPAFVTLGRAHLALHDVEEARRAFNDAVRLNPSSLAPLLELADLHLSRNEIDTAVGFAEQAVNANRQSLPARLMLIRALTRQPTSRGRVESELKALLAKHPDVPQVHAAVGEYQLNLGNAAVARSAFARVLALDPQSIEALSGLVTLDLAAKDVSRARARLDVALAQDKPTVGVLLAAARVYQLTGETQKIESTLRRALAIDPSNPEIYGALGQALVDAGRLVEATKEFSEVARLQPRSVAAPTMLGLLAYAQGDLATAETWWQKALEIDARAAAAANNLAYVLADRGDNLELALQLAQVAKSKYPDLAEVNDTLGWVYYRKGLSAMATQFLEHSVTRDQSNPLYHYHLGMAYADRGDDSKARRSLERALALNANFPGAAQARKTLTTLVF